MLFYPILLSWTNYEERTHGTPWRARPGAVRPPVGAADPSEMPAGVNATELVGETTMPSRPAKRAPARPAGAMCSSSRRSVEVRRGYGGASLGLARRRSEPDSPGRRRTTAAPPARWSRAPARTPRPVDGSGIGCELTGLACLRHHSRPWVLHACADQQASALRPLLYLYGHRFLVEPDLDDTTSLICVSRRTLIMITRRYGITIFVQEPVPSDPLEPARAGAVLTPRRGHSPAPSRGRSPAFDLMGRPDHQNL